jgi:molybdate transport system substrate-binding protein
MNTPLNILSAGAAMGLVKQLLGDAVTGSFGAVGAMHDNFLAGEPCDILILARKQLDELSAAGALLAGTLQNIGHVQTGIATRTGDAAPAIHDTASLQAALQNASMIYAPDMVKSTAGQHVAKVLRTLSIQTPVSEHPNGAIAMKTMAASASVTNATVGADSALGTPLGCTQATEILYTPGVTLIGLLPPEFELSTLYSVAVPKRSSNPAAAQQLIAQLLNPSTVAARQAAGFEC